MATIIKNLKVTYTPVNKENTFTSGDCVSGEVTLEVVKDCRIQSLSIILKGIACVMWFESRRVFNRIVEESFCMTQDFIQDSSIVSRGCHVYPFKFQIPEQNMPPSYGAFYGTVLCFLGAKLNRSMKCAKKHSVRINVVPKADLTSSPELTIPQHESKRMKLCNSGEVILNVNLEKTNFFQGDGLKVVAFIQNNSTRDIRPKYCVYRKLSLFVRGRRIVRTQDLLKEVGDPIPPSANEKVTRIINIPHNVEPSILTCSILKAEYRLRVCLDVRYVSGPEINLPIVILPSSPLPAVTPPPAIGFRFHPLVYSDPPVWSFAP